MLSHITTDLHQVYLEEVFTPQLGKPGASTPAKPKSSSDIDGDGDVDSFEKNVRQVIYDVRHIMKEKKVPAEQAFKLRTSKTNYSAEVIETAKKKLGIIGGSSTSVSEESTGRMVKVTINYKNGTIDRRNVPYSEVSQLRSKPTISSVEVSSNKVSYPGAGEKYEKKYGKRGQNTVGDRDRDGTKEPDRHEYAGVRDTAIKKSKSMSRKKKLKGYGVSEGFSNWREDLKEVTGIDDTITSRDKKQVKEKPGLDNHTDKTVVINPNFEEEVEILGGTIVESFELNEEYISEAVDIATEFFYNYGLNENGVDIVIEELGEEKFAEFVFDLSEEYFLSEELKKSESKVKTSKAPKGTKQYATTIARVKKQGGTRTQMKPSNLSGTINKRNIGKEITAAKALDATKKAKEEQEPSPEKSRPAGQERIRKTVNDTISKVTSPKAKKTAGNLVKGTLNTVARAGLSAWEGHKKAMEKKKEGASTAQQLGSGARKALGSFFTKGTKQFREWVEYLISEGYDLSDLTAEELYEEYGYLCEKAESEQQQKLFGLALSVKRGETSRSEVSAEVLKIVDTMSEKKIRDFAKTPHSDVPKKVNEAIANSTRKTQKETDRIQVLQKMLKIERRKKGLGEEMAPTTPEQISIRKRLIQADLKALQKLKPEPKTSQPQEPQTQNASYEPEGELVDEARAEERRGLGSTGTQRQRQKSGESGPTGKRPVTSYSGGQNPHTRGKKYLNKTQRREASRRYVDQPGGVYADPENQQGKNRYLDMQTTKRNQSNMSTKGT